MSIEARLQEIERAVADIRAEAGEERIILVGLDGFRREISVPRASGPVYRLPKYTPSVNRIDGSATTLMEVRDFVFRGYHEEGKRVFTERP